MKQNIKISISEKPVRALALFAGSGGYTVEVIAPPKITVEVDDIPIVDDAPPAVSEFRTEIIKIIVGERRRPERFRKWKDFHTGHIGSVERETDTGIRDIFKEPRPKPHKQGGMQDNANLYYLTPPNTRKQKITKKTDEENNEDEGNSHSLVGRCFALFNGAMLMLCNEEKQLSNSRLNYSSDKFFSL